MDNARTLNSEEFSHISVLRTEASIAAETIDMTQIAFILNEVVDQIQIIEFVVNWKIYDAVTSLYINEDSYDARLTYQNLAMRTANNKQVVTSLQNSVRIPIVKGWSPLNLFVDRLDTLNFNRIFFDLTLQFNALPANGVTIGVNAVMYYKFKKFS